MTGEESLLEAARNLASRAAELDKARTQADQERARLAEASDRLERAAIAAEAEIVDKRESEARAAADAATIASLRARIDELLTIIQVPRGDADVPLTATLEEVRKHIAERVADGVQCPACSRFAKRYKRKLNSSMAAALIGFYRHVAGLSEWVHIPKETQISRLGGDWAKLSYWGLIETRVDQEREDNGPNSGFWRITDKGISFVRGEISVPTHVLTYDAAMLGFDDSEMTTIQEALGKKFDYNELMGTRGVPASLEQAS